MEDLTGKNIVLGVTGGIACFKAAGLVSLYKKAGAQVFVIMTKNALNFITPLTLETLSNNKVYIDMFETGFNREVEHITLAKRADIFVVAPATANFIGKYALGIADDFLSTTIMATKAPVLIAPAMNSAMYENEAVQKNIETLKARGVHFIEPDEGLLACGDFGKGRMPEPPQIADETAKIVFKKKDYINKTVLITAGGTESKIDPVRVITNRSSGKMGLSIANEAYERGGKVIFIHGNVSDEVKKEAQKFKPIIVKTTEEMYKAVLDNLKQSDIIIKAAAPSDYTVTESGQKIKAESLTLTLTKTTDIAAQVGKIKKDKKLIIFAAETENLTENAKNKLKAKNADMVVANDITKEGAGFNVNTNIATLITSGGETALDKMTKKELARVILDKALTL